MDLITIVLTGGATGLFTLFSGRILSELYGVRDSGGGKWQLTKKKKTVAALEAGGNSGKDLTVKVTSPSGIRVVEPKKESRLKEEFLDFVDDFMGNGQRKRQRREVRDAEMNRKNYEEARASLMAMSAEDVADVFYDFRKQLLSVQFVDSDFSKKEQKALSYAVGAVDMISALWGEIRWAQVSGKDAVIGVRVLTVALPEAVAFYQKQCVLLGVKKAWDETRAGGTGFSYTSAAKKFADIVHELGKIKNQQMHRVVKAEVTDDAGSKVLVFPEVSNSGCEAVDAALLSLREVWDEAVLRRNTVEDEFLLEQVAVSYVPETMKLLKAFRFSDEVSQRKAEELVVKQLELLEHEVVRVLAASNEITLNALESQLSFLESRKQLNEAHSGLELPASGAFVTVEAGSVVVEPVEDEVTRGVEEAAKRRILEDKKLKEAAERIILGAPVAYAANTSGVEVARLLKERELLLSGLNRLDKLSPRKGSVPRKVTGGKGNMYAEVLSNYKNHWNDVNDLGRRKNY